MHRETHSSFAWGLLMYSLARQNVSLALAGSLDSLIVLCRLLLFMSTCVVRSLRDEIAAVAQEGEEGAHIRHH